MRIQTSPNFKMTLYLLALAVFAMAAFDARLTARRISDYGPGIELNSVIASLSTKIGSEGAALIGIMIPNALAIALSIHYNWGIFLGGLVGFKLRYFYNQIQSLRVKKFLREVKADINSKSSGPSACSPSQATDEESVSSHDGPKSSNG